jgi:hypothetical protein
MTISVSQGGVCWLVVLRTIHRGEQQWSVCVCVCVCVCAHVCTHAESPSQSTNKIEQMI